jgi:putative phosphoribosyl transferase
MPPPRMPGRFPNRTAAGRQLAEQLKSSGLKCELVLAMPRGGVPVGYELARALRVPLDVLVAKRVSAPGQPQLAIGAVAPGVQVLHDALIEELGISRRYVECAIAEQVDEVEDATARYRLGRPALELIGRIVVLVDDGLASGSTAAAALSSARKHGARHLVFAIPVGSAAGVHEIRDRADHICCLHEVSDLGMVSDWYEDFSPPSEAEVLALLRQAARST